MLTVIYRYALLSLRWCWMHEALTPTTMKQWTHLSSESTRFWNSLFRPWTTWAFVHHIIFSYEPCSASVKTLSAWRDLQLPIQRSSRWSSTTTFTHASRSERHLQLIAASRITRSLPSWLSSTFLIVSHWCLLSISQALSDLLHMLDTDMQYLPSSHFKVSLLCRRAI